MITLDLGPDDLTRLRFAFSPVWETVTSIRTLATAPSSGLHMPWLRAARPHLDGIDLRLLTALVPAEGYSPDFLTPTLPTRTQTFAGGLAAIAATPHDLVIDELRMLPAADDPTVRALIRDPAKALDRITFELDRYWTRAIEPHWPRIRSLLRADLAYRMEQLASGGVELLFRTLHPTVEFDGGSLKIRKPYCPQSPLGGRGLLLVPCAFAWPKVMMLTSPPHIPTVGYSPRGVGLLWESPSSLTPSPLADLIGRTRAAILAQLDLPMTTAQLACQLDLSAPTLSAHLQILKAGGAVTARREGRAVLYSRTGLGRRLLNGADR